jgi:hypothetical protein
MSGPEAAKENETAVSRITKAVNNLFNITQPPFKTWRLVEIFVALQYL